MRRRAAFALIAGLLVGAVSSAIGAVGPSSAAASFFLTAIISAVAAAAVAALEPRGALGRAQKLAPAPAGVGAPDHEALLRTIVEASPAASLLLGPVGRVIHANQAARELLFEGRALEGHNFLGMLEHAPAPFCDAVLGDDDDRLFTVEEGGDGETYHLSKRRFDFGGVEHTLVLVRELTRELRRQEVDTWKKLIRVISHELNNSLAPIASLAHSARKMVGSPEHAGRLDRAFTTIDERVQHLREFLDSYARFARLPAPRRTRVDWAALLDRVKTLAPHVRVGAPPAKPAFCDGSQIEQVLVNLLKNADEAGGPNDAVTLDVVEDAAGFTITVADRGPGMTDEVLAKALLPFFSTKERGSGIGLPLCREIVEAHQGRLRLANRDGGGLEVTITLPGPGGQLGLTRSRLTLSGG